MKTITIHDGERPHTVDVDDADGISHAQHVLACLGLMSAPVDDDDDGAPRFVLRRDGPPVLTPADVYYRRANVVVTLTANGRTRALTGAGLAACGVDVDDDGRFSEAVARHVARELRVMLEDDDAGDELPF